MKGLIVKKLIIICCLLLFQFGCDSESDIIGESDSGIFFKGDHKLVSLKTTTGMQSKEEMNSSFFLVVGSSNYKSQQSTQKFVNFTWINNKNQWQPTYLPINKIKIQIDSTILEPYCKFRWIPDSYSFTEGNWDEFIIYVVLVLREAHILNKNVIEFNLL